MIENATVVACAAHVGPVALLAKERIDQRTRLAGPVAVVQVAGAGVAEISPPTTRGRTRRALLRAAIHNLITQRHHMHVTRQVIGPAGAVVRRK